MNKRAKIEIAVEYKVVEIWEQMRQVMNGEIESGGSSRMIADEIVDLVLRMNDGEEIEVPLPFSFYAVGK